MRNLDGVHYKKAISNIFSRNDTQLHTVHKRIFITRRDLSNQEVMHGPSIHGCMFLCSLRGSEGLNMDLNMLKRYISEGDVKYVTPHLYAPPHIVIPLGVRFKGERVERCHLLPLSEKKFGSHNSTSCKVTHISPG